MDKTHIDITDNHKAAQQAMLDGRLRDAHKSCLAILQVDPSFADAWFLCAVIAAHNGQVEKSVEILHKAISFSPENTEYRAELGKQLIAMSQPELAIEQANIARNLEPTDLPTLNTLGTVFSHSGENEKALACFEQAALLLTEPTQRGHSLSHSWRADLYFNLAVALQFCGRFEDAEQSFERAIEIEPHLFKAHSALATVRRQSENRNHLSRLDEMHSAVKTPRDQLHLGHAIAKEQEDLGLYTESLASLKVGKQAQADAVAYSSQLDADLFAQAREGFSRDFIIEQSSGCESSEPIFIVGMPRTGTTLVEQILSSHSQVFAAGELQNFPLQVKRLTESTTPDVLDAETLQMSARLNMEQLGNAYLQSTRPRTGHTPHFIDKLPLNFMYIGLIKSALPNAKIICLRRDPMDTCLSNYRQLFAVNFKHYHYNYNLLDCGRYYIEFDRLIRHWQDVTPGSVHELAYEDLVSNPEKLSRELVGFCELDWEDACLSFHQQKTSVATPSAVQVRQNIYNTSVNRWQRYGDALQPLYNLLQSAGFYS